MYLADEAVNKDVEKAFECLESAKRYSTRLNITRGSNALLESWNLLMRYIIMSSIIQNGCRSGVLENMTIQEFEAADKLRGKWMIHVAAHKREESGAAKVRVKDVE